MGLPRKYLNDGEEILLELHPHMWFFARSVTLLLLALVAGVGATSYFDGNSVAGYAGAVLIVGAVAVFVADWLRWRTTLFVLTTDRLVERQGVISRSGREIPLERINDISFHQSILERMLGAGDLLVESGGERGQQTFPNMARPFDVQNAVYSAIEAASARDAQRARGTGLSIPEQIEKLDDLRRRGAISDAEFAAKKQKLLDRL